MKKNGFTVVELLVAVSVIIILATIVVAGYGEWTKRVARSAVQSDLKNAAAAMENARNFSSGYPLSIPTTFKKSSDVNLTYKTGGTAASYCLNASSISEPSVVYYLSSTGGNTVPAAGTCP